MLSLETVIASCRWMLSLLLNRLFGKKEILDPLGHMAGFRADAMSILIGVAADQSNLPGKAVKIDDQFFDKQT